MALSANASEFFPCFAALNITDSPAKLHGCVAPQVSVPNNNSSRKLPTTKDTKRRRKRINVIITSTRNLNNHEKKQPQQRQFKSNAKKSRSRRRKGSKRREDENYSSLETAFPPLHAISNTDINSNTKSEVDLSKNWSAIAQTAHESSLKQSRQDKAMAHQQAEETSILDLRLSPLRPSRLPKLSPFHNSHQHQVQIETKTKEQHSFEQQRTEQPQLKTTMIGTTNRFDMSKLRDRWWHLLREKRQQDHSNQKARLEQWSAEIDEKSVSTCSSDYDDHTVSSDSTKADDDYSATHDDDESDDAGQKVIDVSSLVDCPFPLHQAILAEDQESISTLLSLNKSSLVRADASVRRKDLGLSEAPKLYSAEAFSPLQLAVYLDRPHLVKLLLEFTPSILITAMDEKQRTPLMLAAEVGLDSCIKILLSYGAAMHIADTSGNNAFHHACRAGSPASTLRLLLGYSSRVTSQQQRALLLLKNNQGQTVLHVASECGHAHLVEIFLSTCGASLLTKMLQMQDARSQTPLLTAIAAGSTDVVMCILMWRGNHQNPGRQWQSIRSNKIGGSRLDTSSSTCPLIWAISKGSSDMVHLLLEFNGASLLTATSCSYNLLGALHATVHSNHYDRVEIIRILVQAGADPCADVSQELAGAGESTSVSTAACKGDIEALHAMLDTFEQVKRTNGIARRKDPKLRRQPNSYFTALESKENKLYSAALCDALVKTLFIGWRSPSDDSSQCCLRSAVALVKKGANLSDAGFERLKQSIAARKLKPPVEFSEEAGWFRFEATYIQYGDLNSDTFSKSLTTFDRSALQFWSKALCEMPWMKTEENTIHCSWMKGELLASDNSAENVDKVALIAGDTRFLVHSAIVSAKSAKLDAAIRFALMNKSTNAPNCGAPVEVRIELSAKICKLLLQHIYHGSIISGWSSDFAECCRELLELSLVAEEYLCPSLLNECEMRLCSANPFRCYCWSCCTVVKIVETSSCSQNMPTAACLYRADGPSRLLSAETVLDALAVSQQLGEFRRNDDLLKFRLLATAPVDSVFSDHAVWQNFIANNSCLTTPFGGVKYASVQFLLKNLCAVLNSVSYASHIEGLFQTSRDSRPPEQHAHYEAQMMLLQVCLEELNVSVLNKSKGYPATNRFE